MKMKRLGKQYMEEVGRMSENLWTGGGGSAGIKDRQTFDTMFVNYFETKTRPFKNEEALKNTMFKYLQEEHPKQISKKNIFKEAGGKDFKKDQKTMAKKQVVTVEEYIRLGSQKVDLAGYDTPQGFIFTGRRKAKGRSIVVKSRVINTKRGIRFIDRKGRYVSVKNKNKK